MPVTRYVTRFGSWDRTPPPSGDPPGRGRPRKFHRSERRRLLGQALDGGRICDPRQVQVLALSEAHASVPMIPVAPRTCSGCHHAKQLRLSAGGTKGEGFWGYVTVDVGTNAD